MPELFERREKTRVYKKRFNVISNEVIDLPDQREGPYNDTRICSEYYSLFGTLRVHEIPPYVGMTAPWRGRAHCIWVHEVVISTAGRDLARDDGPLGVHSTYLFLQLASKPIKSSK